LTDHFFFFALAAGATQAKNGGYKFFVKVNEKVNKKKSNVLKNILRYSITTTITIFSIFAI
jgi:anaerobic C4-dicarboxylate transporter